MFADETLEKVKRCRECKQPGRFARTKYGLRIVCNKCSNAKRNSGRHRLSPEERTEINHKQHVAAASWRAVNKRRIKHNQLKRDYGITIEHFEKMQAQQNNACAICHQVPKSATRSLNVDHCHKTGKVRGLLCWRCNIGLGKFKDQIEYLRNAAKYLEDAA